MAEQTRVEKFKQLREEIAKMDDANRVSTPYQVPNEHEAEQNNADEGEVNSKKKGTRSISLDDIFKAHDAYTSIVAQEEVQRKKEFEEQQRKIEKRNKIIIISLFSLLFVIFLVILIVLIVS